MASKERATRARVLGSISWYLARNYTRGQIVAALDKKYTHLRKTHVELWLGHAYSSRQKAGAISRASNSFNVSPNELPSLVDRPTGIRVQVLYKFASPTRRRELLAYDFFDFAGGMTKQDLLNQIREKIIDNMFKQYKNRVARRDTIDRRITDITLFRVEGI